MIGFNVILRASTVKGASSPQHARVIALDRVNQQIRIVVRMGGDGTVRDLLPKEIIGFEIEDSRMQVSHRFKTSEMLIADWGSG